MRKNPTSAIRTGFDYQDFWGLWLCGEWLNNPDKYQWIWFETAPSEDHNSFFLDDIILLDKSEKYHLYQIKYKQNPETDKWSWDDLLKQEKKKGNGLKDSLIQKWFTSFIKPDLRDRIGYAAFITNGCPEEDLKGYIVDNKIDINKVREKKPEIYSIIQDQLREDDNIIEFFNNFCFSFCNNDRDIFEKKIREFLFKEIRATENGINKLIWHIHTEAGRPRTQPIIIEQLRQWCEFDQPRHLNEQFEIPQDFEFFDGIEHNKIFQDLRKSSGGIKVFYGKPGTGKSTYLSKLHELLKNKNVISIRHHYHISPNDPDPIARLKRQRVIEALKAQFKEFSDELGGLFNKNSQNVPLNEYISKISSYCNDKARTFVLIIDGLDHVLSQGDGTELRNFLSDICFPQPGLWIVFGMQEIAKQYLPPIVFDYAPENSWIEIKGLNSAAVDRILSKNIIGLKLPSHLGGQHNLGYKLYKNSEGNPLHLRYSLQQLKNQLADDILTESSIESLLPYDANITNYYHSLWRKLPMNSKTIAILIACVGFQFKKGQMFDLLSTLINNPAEIAESFLSISHILLIGKNNGLSIYHNSFRLFLIDQVEFKEQATTSKRRIKDWLEKSNCEDLKWAELRKLSYYLGDPKPIMQINRDWLIDAILNLREPNLITSQFILGKEAAFKAGRFDKVLELSVLSNTYLNTQEFHKDAWIKIWKMVFNKGKYDHLNFDLSTLAGEQIEAVVKEGIKNKDFNIINEAIDTLNELNRNQTIRGKGETTSEFPHFITNTIKIIGLDKNHETERVYRYLKQFRSSGWTPDLFSFYANILINTKQNDKLSRFLKLDFQDDEFQAIISKCAENDNALKADNFFKLISSQRHETLNYLCIIYLVIRGIKLNKLPSLPSYDLFPITVPEYESSKSEERAQIFTDNFILGLIYSLSGSENEIIKWINEADDRWSLNIMVQFYYAAIAVSKSILSKTEISTKLVFENLEKVVPLRWPEDRNLYELQLCLKKSLSSVFYFLINIKLYSEETVKLTFKDLDTLVASKYFDRLSFLDLLLSYRVPLLDKKAYEKFINKENDIWSEKIAGFPERSEHYADLSQLAYIHGDKIYSKKFLKLAVDNLLGYGYHRDSFLYTVLQSIKICHQTGSKKTLEWVKRLAAIVENVTGFTDGDETSHIQEYLAEILSDVDVPHLYKYYKKTVDDEKLFLAENIFNSIISSLKFEKNIDISVASTSLDTTSYETLTSISIKNIGAKKALNSLNEYFGNIYFDKEEHQPHVLDTKNTKENYTSITPQMLRGHLLSLHSKYDRDRYTAKWLEHWVYNNNTSLDILYDICISIVEGDGLSNGYGEMLDLLYPIAFQFDNEKAFELLCRAQSNYGGWDIYYTDEEKSIKRWKFVAENYPDRYLEFFEKSILYVSKRYSRNDNYYMPLPRGIEFFSLFNELKIIENVTEIAVNMMESFMANLKLKEAEWLSVTNIDLFDILIQRLITPSPLVRERVASTIAELFNYDDDKEIFFDRYLVWLKNQKLESLITNSLLPIIKALEKKDGLYEYINMEEVIKSVPFTSFIIEKLLDEIAILLKKEIKVQPNRSKVLKPPEEYRPDDFFTKNIQGFLPPIYFIRSEKITSNTFFNFLKYWSFNSQEIIKSMNLKERIGDAMNFLGYHPPRMLGMATLLSEVYRSAYIRVLQYMFDFNLIDENDYYRYMYSTFPIDISLWKIKTNRSPSWWPVLSHETEKESYKNEIISFDFPYEYIKNLIGIKNKFTLVGINGTAMPKKGWSEGVSDTSIYLVGFAYKVTGSKIPDAKIIAEEILNRSFLFTRGNIVPRPFCILEHPNYFIPSHTKPSIIDDITIYPLIAPLKELSTNTWQWFRSMHPHMLLFRPPSEDNILRLEKKSLCHYMKDRLIAKSLDWTQGIQERLDLDVPHGTYIEVDSEYLENYLDSIGFRLGYVIRMNHQFRKYSYDEAQSIEDYKLMDVSKIII
jgi:hypothetical protein